MMYLWTAEVAADGQGFRVLGYGEKGKFSIPPSIAMNYPAVLSIHVTALNANGKAYSMRQSLPAQEVITAPFSHWTPRRSSGASRCVDA